MGRRKKPSGRLRRGPFTASDFETAIKLDGWVSESDGPHSMWRHPSRPGKITIDGKWTGVRSGHDAFRGIATQGGYTSKELIRLLNGMPLR